MKNLVFLLTLVSSLFLYSTSNAQSNIIVCGSVIGANGVPVTVYISDSLNGVSSTAITDSSGNFCDTISVPTTQGMVTVGIYDCNGNYISQSLGYNPILNVITFTFNYCNTLPSSNVVVCVTVDNLPGGTTVPVIVYSTPGTVGDTLLFTGTGTQTLCDTFAVASGTGTVLLSMIDCNGNTISAQATYNPFFPTANVTMDYCQVLTPVTVCGTVNGTNGMAVNVVILDSISGQTYTFTTDTSGNFCDTLMLPATQGMLIASIVDCNGNTIYQVATYSPTGPNYNFTFNYCNSTPNQFLALCVTVDNLPGVNTTVPVIVYSNPGGVGDTLFFNANGSLTICDTFQVANGAGVVILSLVDCNGNTVSVTAQYNPMNPVANVTLDYCAVTPPCYAYWTSVYDSVSNTFYITIDSVTLAQAQTFFWDFGDSTFSTLPNPTHQFSVNGLYNVCLTINATPISPGCSYCHTIGITPNGGIITRVGGFNVVVLPQSTTGVQELESSDYSLYPNPFNDFLTIESDASESDWKVSVYAISGELTFEGIYNNVVQAKVDMRSYNSGIYIIKIQTEKGIEVVKAIKE